jgi:hypothetical protein
LGHILRAQQPKYDASNLPSDRHWQQTETRSKDGMAIVVIKCFSETKALKKIWVN